ncbi:flagellar basal body-associated protein FliL [Cellulomonas sp. 179-A 4D5 NHS]|uniref:flagellar basal body-associated FliL family protein n=1 Tax=Cellulomonas sp. 179-A 4D5 NHS TaxID=3142378 RepID=UPI0039A0710A
MALLVLGGGAGYWFVLGPGSTSSAEAEVEPEPEPGKVQTVESFSLNLAGGRYLRLGLGLQLSAEVLEDIDTSKAVDRALTLFSGRTLEEVSSPEGRTALKDELTRLLKEAYHGEVIAVYFTDYVTQ